MRDAFIGELTDLAAADPSVMLITGDLGFGVLTDFAKRLPEQFLNVGVAEQNMTGLACGLALEGHKVYTYSIGNFSTLRPLEQIRNDICYHDVDVTVVSVGGGFSYGQLGMSHFAIEDLAILRALPNMQVIAPADPWETRQLTQQMAAQTGPKYLRLDKGQSGLPEEVVSLGQTRLVRNGNDITVIAVGAILLEALLAADILEKSGISTRILAVHSIKPFDGNLVLDAARETGGLITLEEHSILGGLGSVVAETCVDAGICPQFFKRMGLNDVFPSQVGDQNFLRNAYGMDAAAIVAVAQNATG